MRNLFLGLIALTLTLPLVAVSAGQRQPVGTTFKVSPDATIVLAEGKSGSLTNLNVGDKIRITYHGDVTNAVIEQIHLIVTPKNGVRGARVRVGNHQADGSTHLRGVITAVDPQAGTVTMRVKQRKRRQPQSS